MNTQQPRFLVGDFVRLKGQNESPTMTVERNTISRFYREYSGVPISYDVSCSWWNSKKNKFESEVFEEAILEKLEENHNNQ